MNNEYNIFIPRVVFRSECTFDSWMADYRKPIPIWTLVGQKAFLCLCVHNDLNSYSYLLWKSQGNAIKELRVMARFASTLPGIYISGRVTRFVHTLAVLAPGIAGYLRVCLDINIPAICLDIHTYLVFRGARLQHHLSNVLLTSSKGNLPLVFAQSRGLYKLHTNKL